MSDEKECVLEYGINEYFVKKLSTDVFLITTRHGAWMILSKKEYDCLRLNNLGDSVLFSQLEKKGIIFTNKNIQSIMNSFNLHYSFLNTQTMRCIVSLTNRCTLKCNYCHACASPDDSNIQDMADETIHKILDFIGTLPHKKISIEFQGGEPLLRFDLLKKFLRLLEQKLLLCGKELDSKVIVSNLTLMNEEIANYIIENKIGLCTSLDGPKVLHDFHRMYTNDNGSYDDVVKWAKYLKQKGKNVNFLPTITSKSIELGSKAIIDEYVRLGIDRINFRAVHNIGRGKELLPYMTVDSFFEFWKSGVEYLVELNLLGVKIHDYAAAAYLKNILTPVRPYMCLRRPCGAGISQIAFNVLGDILPCDLARSIPKLKIGDVFSSDYVDVGINLIDIKSRISESIPLCDSCVFNPYCGACLCRNYADFKDITVKSPQDFDCKLNKKIYTYLFLKLLDDKYRNVFERWVVVK